MSGPSAANTHSTSTPLLRADFASVPSTSIPAPIFLLCSANQLNHLPSRRHCHISYHLPSMQQGATDIDVPSFKTPCGRKVKVEVLNEMVHNNAGNFSTVYRGKITQIREDGSRTPQIEVALKKQIVKQKKIYRELAILRSLSVSHPQENIVKLLYSRSQRRTEKKQDGDEDGYIHYTLVFHLMQQTLSAVKRQIFESRDVLDIKLYAWQIFAGLDHLRKLRIIHRDIKPVNMLIDSNTGKLQIADFGSAIYFPCRRHLNFNYAVTRPYRPPEMILKTNLYTCMVDVWSAGCIFAELYLGTYLFYQNTRVSEAEQLQFTYTILGVPSAEDLRAMNVLDTSKFVPSNSQNVINNPVVELSQRFLTAGYQNNEELAKIVDRILRYDPDKRLHGRKLLMDPFFDELFKPNRRRTNGIPVAAALTGKDRERIGGTPV